MDSDRIVIRRAASLHGEVVVPGAKNSVLKLMAATLLADGVYRLSNVPAIADVTIMSDLLAAIGVSTSFNGDGSITMTNHGNIVPVAPYELVERIRASINVLGPLLGRCGHVKLSLPGGDDFGSRPIDMHLKGLEAIGATFEMHHGYVEATAERLHGADITLEFPSVGATENILTAAIHAKGTTIIDNAAREPEITDLCAMLTSMGADIEGAGSSTLAVHGVEPGSLRATDHAVVADRIQAATYLAAVAVSGGEVVLRGARADHMDMLLRRFADMGVTVTSTGDGLAVFADQRLRSIDVATLPYPGIATDYKPLIVTMLSVADGVGIVTENLYPGRVPLRGGTAATRRRHSHRRSSRSRPRRVAVERSTGARARHSRRRRTCCRRACRRGRDGGQRCASRRSRLRRSRRSPGWYWRRHRAGIGPTTERSEEGPR